MFRKKNKPAYVLSIVFDGSDGFKFISEWDGHPDYSVLNQFLARLGYNDDVMQEIGRSISRFGKSTKDDEYTQRFLTDLVKAYNDRVDKEKQVQEKPKLKEEEDIILPTDVIHIQATRHRSDD